MTVVSSKEFATHQRKYFGIAMDGGVCIKRGRNMFRLMHEPAADEQPILQPDEDLRRAISMEEFKQGVLEDIHQFYASK
jgi:predicted transcriptional regulator